MRIPPILHFVWVGPGPMPTEHRGYIEGWRRVMPDWPIKAWTDAEIDWSVRYLQQAYATRGWNRISNYMRMRALYEHGGFYLDTDVELVKPLDPRQTFGNHSANSALSPQGGRRSRWLLFVVFGGLVLRFAARFSQRGRIEQQALMRIFKAFPARTEQRPLEQRDILRQGFERRLLILNRRLLLRNGGLLLRNGGLLLFDEGLLPGNGRLLLGMHLGHRPHPGMALG